MAKCSSPYMRHLIKKFLWKTINIRLGCPYFKHWGLGFEGLKLAVPKNEVDGLVGEKEGNISGGVWYEYAGWVLGDMNLPAATCDRSLR